MKAVCFALFLAAACGAGLALTKEFIFNGTAIDWFSANAYCKQNYRALAAVGSPEENQQLLQSGKQTTGVWTGLRRNLDNTWGWADKEKIPLPSWIGDWDFQMSYYCVIVKDTGDYVPNQWCLNKNPFYCYRVLVLVKEKKTWDEALEFCETNYTGLASVTSESSLRQLKLEMNGTGVENVWTGLRFVDGGWLWVSKEELGRAASMPACADPSYRCGALNTRTDTMSNQNCNQKLDFVCYLN